MPFKLNSVYCSRALLLSIALLTVACAPTATKVQIPPSAAQMLEQCCWKLRAKVGLSQHGKKQSAMLNWHQEREEFSIRLNGPLGLGAVKLSGNEQNVLLEQAGKEPIHASSPEVLLRQATGIETPLENLKYWLRGQPGPMPVTQLSMDDSGLRFQQFEQAGWLVSLDRYRHFGQFELPARITIRATDERYPGQLLTVLVSRWSFTTPSNSDS